MDADLRDVRCGHGCGKSTAYAGEWCSRPADDTGCRKKARLWGAVREALDRGADENGYARLMLDMEPRQLATDLLDHDATFEGLPIEAVLEPCTRWQRGRREAL